MQFVLPTLIHWTVIYPVDSVIHPLNNWGQDPRFWWKQGGLLHVAFSICVDQFSLSQQLRCQGLESCLKGLIGRSGRYCQRAEAPGMWDGDVVLHSYKAHLNNSRKRKFAGHGGGCKYPYSLNEKHAGAWKSCSASEGPLIFKNGNKTILMNCFVHEGT